MTEKQTQTWQTTDDDIQEAIRLMKLDPPSAESTIALHTLIQQRRLADAAERQAEALEILAGSFNLTLFSSAGGSWAVRTIGPSGGGW